MRPQVTVGPEILEGTKGTLLTESDLAPEMPQVLPAFTVILPLVKTLLLMLVLMLLVADVPLYPVGNVQL